MTSIDIDVGTIELPIDQYNDLLYGEEYCHVTTPDDDISYCGINFKGVGKQCMGWWSGETVCPVCGSPVCPTCIHLSNLEDEIEGW